MSLIRKMQIESMVKYHLSPYTVTKIQKLENVLFSEALRKTINAPAMYAKYHAAVVT